MNKAIHQLTYTQDRDDVNDRFYMVRSATDYQLPGTALPPKLNVASRLLTDTQVLALYTTPLEIVSGTGPTTADPVRSFFQTATIGVRMRMDVSWKMRRSGMVQWIDGTSW